MALHDMWYLLHESGNARQYLPKVTTAMVQRVCTKLTRHLGAR